MEPIEFTIYGEPRPAGSKQSFPVINQKTGEPVRAKDTGRIITRVKHDNPKTQEWMSHVAQVAGEVMADGPMFEGPVSLTLIFFRPRPKTHYGTGKNAETIKDSAPVFPTTRPDTVKLTRAVEDALTGVCWKDDSQVVNHKLAKRYGKRFEVWVLIEPLQAAQRQEEK